MCDYLIKGDERKQFKINAPLTIDAGTVLLLEQDVRVLVSEGGSINAVGTPEARIKLEGLSPTQGYWQGICLRDNLESRFEYVDIVWGGKDEAGGSGSGGCNAAVGGDEGESISLKHVVISGSRENGLDATNLTLGDFEQNVFSNNLEYGVMVSSSNAHKLDSGSDYLGETPNGKPYVFLENAFRGQGESVTWRKLNVPYFNEKATSDQASILLSDNVTVTVEAGTRLEFGENGSLSVFDGATLNAVGTADAPIVFTGKEQTPGLWQGILFLEATGVFEYAQVSYGGRQDMPNGNIMASGSNGSSLTVRNSTISHSETCGISVNDASTFEESTNTFSNNATDVCN